MLRYSVKVYGCLLYYVTHNNSIIYITQIKPSHDHISILATVLLFFRIITYIIHCPAKKVTTWI